MIKDQADDTPSRRQQARDIEELLGDLQRRLPARTDDATAIQLRHLDLVAAHPAISVTRLAELSNNTIGNTSATTLNLMRRGWMRRTRTSSRGQTLLSLTAEGRSARRRHAAARADVLARAMASLTDAQRRKLREGLAALVRSDA
jgi:DNA-binding MarR family transcriptional regulator